MWHLMMVQHCKPGGQARFWDRGSVELTCSILSAGILAKVGDQGRRLHDGPDRMYTLYVTPLGLPMVKVLMKPAGGASPALMKVTLLPVFNPGVDTGVVGITFPGRRVGANCVRNKMSTEN